MTGIWESSEGEGRRWRAEHLPATYEEIQPNIQIENALGVSCVRSDTLMLARLAAHALPAHPGRRALDLGTGTGYVAIYLALHDWQVDAVDVSPRALELAHRNTRLNGVAPRVFHSDLYGAVQGPYEVIACNPPMRGSETEGSRLLTSTLRRAPPLANLLLRITQPILARRRRDFLVQIAQGARDHLGPQGRLLLVISPAEATALLERAPGLSCLGSRPIRSIPGLSVFTFAFADAPVDASA